MEQNRPTGKVIAEHQTSYPDPIVLKPGDRVRIVKRDTEWEGWVWCVHESGKEGWVPENGLLISGNEAVAKREYNAFELTVSVGEVVEILEEESGWLLCKSRSTGQTGWVPKEIVTSLL